MTVQLVDPSKTYDCCVCWSSVTSSWADLATEGWRQHYAGIGIDPVTLCGSCSTHMADRREANRKAIEEELKEPE